MKLLSTALLTLIALNVGLTNQTDPTGEWVGSYSSEKVTGKIALKINKDDKGSLTGEIIVTPPNRPAHPAVKFSSVEINGSILKINFSAPDTPEDPEITATITGNQMNGSYTVFVNGVSGETGSIKTTRK